MRTDRRTFRPETKYSTRIWDMAMEKTNAASNKRLGNASGLCRPKCSMLFPADCVSAASSTCRVANDVSALAPQQARWSSSVRLLGDECRPKNLTRLKKFGVRVFAMF